MQLLVSIDFLQYDAIILFLSAVHTLAVLKALVRTWAAVHLMWAKRDQRQRMVILLVGVLLIILWNLVGESRAPILNASNPFRYLTK